jgi:nucleotide-binding universal stress UspA family protein
MVTTVLVPVGGSDLSWKAFRHALRTFPEASIVVLNVVDPQETHYGEGQLLYDDDEYEELERAQRRLFQKAERIADDEFGRSIEVVAAISRIPEDAILTYAEEQDVDQIVLGSHGRRSVADIILGSVSRAVVRNAPVPVTVVR